MAEVDGVTGTANFTFFEHSNDSDSGDAPSLRKKWQFQCLILHFKKKKGARNSI